MKELTLDEISLLEEMKSNCLKKGQYIDEKAKDKFKMLCHLEDFSIAYYELLDAIKEVREKLNKLGEELEISEGIKWQYDRIEDILQILDKGNNNE